jgi:hypothetical protein
VPGPAVLDTRTHEVSVASGKVSVSHANMLSSSLASIFDNNFLFKIQIDIDLLLYGFLSELQVVANFGVDVLVYSLH